MLQKVWEKPNCFCHRQTLLGKNKEMHIPNLMKAKLKVLPYLCNTMLATKYIINIVHSWLMIEFVIL